MFSFLFDAIAVLFLSESGSGSAFAMMDRVAAPQAARLLSSGARDNYQS
jgi:hypothetical protein